eukprot:3591586-Pleurochrysis_carterae.AAC.1
MPLDRALKKLGLRWAPLGADGGDSASPPASEDDDEELCGGRGVAPARRERAGGGAVAPCRYAARRGGARAGRRRTFPDNGTGALRGGGAGRAAYGPGGAESARGGGDSTRAGRRRQLARWGRRLRAGGTRLRGGGEGGRGRSRWARPSSPRWRGQRTPSARIWASWPGRGRAARSRRGRCARRRRRRRERYVWRRPTPPRQSQPTALVPTVEESPRARVIRQLLAEKAAEEADRAAQEGARRAGARALTFDAPPGGARGDDKPVRGVLRAPEPGVEGQPPARRPRPSPGLEELRPPGAEQLATAD